MTSIRELEDNLFNKWRKERTYLIPDGMISETDFNKAKTKICFILKEVNDKNKESSWDLREFVKNGGRSQTWSNIARWNHAIQGIPQEIEWYPQYASHVDKEFRKTWCSSIIAMNLKKTAGGHTTVSKELESIAKTDNEYLIEQFGLYANKVDLVICCGTGWLFKDIIEDSSIKHRCTSRGVDYYLRSDNTPVIMYSHPEARVSSNLLLYPLLDAVKEIQQVIKGNK